MECLWCRRQMLTARCFQTRLKTFVLMALIQGRLNKYEVRSAGTVKRVKRKLFALSRTVCPARMSSIIADIFITQWIVRSIRCESALMVNVYDNDNIMKSPPVVIHHLCSSHIIATDFIRFYTVQLRLMFQTTLSVVAELISQK